MTLTLLVQRNHQCVFPLVVNAKPGGFIMLELLGWLRFERPQGVQILVQAHAFFEWEWPSCLPISHQEALGIVKQKRPVSTQVATHNLFITTRP
jgi:hypothetical protein